MKKLNYYFLALAALLASESKAQVDLNVGLIGKFYFSGNAADSSVIGNNGVVNGAALTTDRCGNTNSAYHFDGVDDNISISGIGKKNNYFSYSVWVYADEIPEENYYTYPFYIGNSGGSHNIALCNNSMKGWAAGSSNNGTPALSLVAMGTQIKPYRWYHVVLVRDTNKIKLFVNGVLNTNESNYGNYNTSTGGNDALYSSVTNVYVGSREPNLDNYFKGKVDDIRIYNRILNSAEIDSLFREEACPLTSINEVNKSIPTTIEIYPNPNNGIFHLKLSSASENSRIQIVDMSGKSVYNELVDDGLYAFELNNINFDNGIYYVLYHSKDGILSKKVIIQN